MANRMFGVADLKRQHMEELLNRGGPVDLSRKGLKFLDLRYLHFGDGASSPQRPDIGIRAIRLNGANLGGADFGGSQLYGVDLNGANLIRAIFTGAYLYTMNISGAHLTAATF